MPTRTQTLQVCPPTRLGENCKYLHDFQCDSACRFRFILLDCAMRGAADGVVAPLRCAPQSTSIGGDAKHQRPTAFCAMQLVFLEGVVVSTRSREETRSGGIISCARAEKTSWMIPGPWRGRGRDNFLYCTCLHEWNHESCKKFGGMFLLFMLT